MIIMANEKKTLIMSTIATIALIAIVVGATYAYFEAQNEASGGANIGVDAATTDVFRLTSSDAIELNANPSNFKQGDANLIGEAQASAYLRANNNTNTATYNYYVYLDIEENDFVYSVDENTPELLLKVYEGEIGENEVTSIPGLTRKTTEDVEGFDITGITRAITIVDNKEITTTSEIEEKWSIEIIFVNLESDQLANQGKTLDASLRIESDSIGAQITEVTISNITSSLITVNTIVEEGKSEIVSYVYGIKEAGNESGELEYTTYESEESTYTFERLENGKKYDIMVKIIDNKGIESIELISNILVADKFTTKIKSLYIEEGTNGLYYHDKEGSHTNADLEAGDNSYRYSGAHDEVNNYVCFGSDEETCPDSNLYRIIGVFNNNGEEQVKLIKYDYATNDMLGTSTYVNSDYNATNYPNYKGSLTAIPRHYYISISSNNMWSESELNTTALNTNYLNYLDAHDTKWRSMIATTTWYQGGMTSSDGHNTNAQTAYNYELGANKVTGTFTLDCDGEDIGVEKCEYDAETNTKVGLMYVSEYYYAASPTYWSSSGQNYTQAIASNWMYMGGYDWTITRITSIEDDYKDGYQVFYVDSSGALTSYFMYVNHGIRPSFNLESSVKYLSGDGSPSTPYRVGM